MHLISLEPSTVLARRDSINIVHMCGHTLLLHTCMFNFQDINIRLQKEFIYIACLCLCQSFTSHTHIQLGKESECSAGIRMHTNTAAKTEICVSIPWHNGAPNTFA